MGAISLRLISTSCDLVCWADKFFFESFCCDGLFLTTNQQMWGLVPSHHSPVVACNVYRGTIQSDIWTNSLKRFVTVSGMLGHWSVSTLVSLVDYLF